MDILEWVANHALPSGVLAEQVNPESGEPLSVSPLTWSHATFVATARRMIRKMSCICRDPEYGRPMAGISLGDDWLAKLYNMACSNIHGNCRF